MRLMRPSAAVLAVAIAAAAAACTRSTVMTVAQVDVAEGAVLVLPTAAQLQDSFNVTQLLNGSFDGHSYTMQAELEWRPGSIAMAALGVWGTAVFSVAYDGSRLEIKGNRLLLQGLQPQYVLADILLAYWDYSKLRVNLRGDGITVVEDARGRSIQRNGVPIITIEYENESRWQGAVHYENIERGYELQIETLGYEELHEQQ